MEIIAIICMVVSAVLGVLLGERHKENRKVAEDLKWQREVNMQLLRNGADKAGAGEEKVKPTGPEPLTVEKIAEAVRMEGFFPEMEGGYVNFKVQGKAYYVDAYRLPLYFLVKEYGVVPADWEMDLLREAAHRMSDELVMVKAIFADDEKSMRFFIAARDGNVDSFRSNLTAYLSILEDGQRKMNEEYHRLVEEKREAAMAAQPVFPSVRPDNKILS